MGSSGTTTLRSRRRPRVLVTMAGLALLVPALSWSADGSPPSPAGERARRAPDLTIRALSTDPVELVQGSSFQARATVKNTGTRGAAATRMRFSMSLDRRRSADDVLLGRPKPVDALAPRRQAVVRARLAAPASLEGRAYLIACVAKVRGERDVSENCRALERVVITRSGYVGQNPDADPIVVDPVLESAKAVSTTIGPDGGSLRTTGADGTSYELVVPEDALASSVEISMTPIASVGGSPYSPDMDGVELKPDGLHLANPATLRITPSTILPAAEASPFAYRSDGLDFVLALYEVVDGSYEMPILHFTGEGIARGTRIQRLSVADSEPYSFQWKRDNEIASALVNGTADIEDVFDRFYDQQLRPALVWATTAQLSEMHKVTAAVVEFLSHARQVMILSEAPRASTQRRIDEGSELIRQATNNMIAKAWSACLNDHQPEHVLTALSLERQASLMGLDVPGDLFDPEGRVPRCLRFELDVRGTYVYTSPTGTAGYHRLYEVGYEGTIPMEIGGADVSDLVLGGEAPLVSFKQTFSEECFRTPCTPCGGSGLGTQFDDPATVLRFDPDLSVILGRGPTGQPALDPRPPEITLAYQPGTSTESWSACGSTFDHDAYQPVFPVIHGAERQVVGGSPAFVIKDWEVLGGEHWAHKEYDASVCAVPETQYPGCYRGYAETSTFDVIHAPDAG